MQSSSTSYSFIDYNESEVDSSIPSNCSLYLFGRALITRNIELIDSLYGLETVLIPKKLNFISNIVKIFKLGSEHQGSEEVLWEI